MRTIRVAVVLVAVAAAVSVSAAPPAAGKARRLAPPEPPPALAVPEEPKDPVVGSCTTPAGACADYQGAFTGVDVQAMCAKAKGNWSGSACPTDGSVGTCTQRQDGSEDRIVTRSYAPTTADAARKACVSLPRGIFLKSN